MTNLSVVGGTSIPAKISGQNLSRSRFTISGPYARVIWDMYFHVSGWVTLVGSISHRSIEISMGDP